MKRQILSVIVTLCLLIALVPSMLLNTAVAVDPENLLQPPVPARPNHPYDIAGTSGVSVISSISGWTATSNREIINVFDGCGKTNTSQNNVVELRGGTVNPWIGLDLGVRKHITEIRFRYRVTGAGGPFMNRFIGWFQGANTADFSDAVLLCTVNSFAQANTLVPNNAGIDDDTDLYWNEKDVSDVTDSFRFVRFLAKRDATTPVTDATPEIEGTLMDDILSVQNIEFYGVSADPNETPAPTPEPTATPIPAPTVNPSELVDLTVDGVTLIGSTVTVLDDGWIASNNPPREVVRAFNGLDETNTTYNICELEAPTVGVANPWIGLDLGGSYDISHIRFRYRSGNDWTVRFIGWFQGANEPDFSDAELLWAVNSFGSSSNPTLQYNNNWNLKDVTDASTKSFRYVRFLGNATTTPVTAATPSLAATLGVWGENTLLSVQNIEFYGTLSSGSTPFDVDWDAKTVTVNDETEGSMLIIAAYNNVDGAKQLIDCIKPENFDEAVSFANLASADEVRVFLWSGGMEPIKTAAR